MPVSCPDCGKEFSKSSNLNRHRREQHGEKKGKNEANGVVKEVECTLCNKQFKRKEHLQLHVNSVHSFGEQKKCSICSYMTYNKSSLVRHINIVHNRKNANKDGQESVELPFACRDCPKHFLTKRRLYLHSRRKHLCVVKTIIVHRKCPLCSFSTNSVADSSVNDEIYNHFRNDHNLAMTKEIYEFENLNEFNMWKSEVERKTSSKFNRTNRRAGKHLRFLCHRSGVFVSKGSGKRMLKKSGSCKINGFCPAAISAFIKENGQVKVAFLNRHIGHEIFVETLESTFFINEVRDESEAFDKAREKFIRQLLFIIRNRVNNVEELEAVQNYCKPIIPMLKTLKSLPNQSTDMGTPNSTDMHVTPDMHMSPTTQISPVMQITPSSQITQITSATQITPIMQITPATQITPVMQITPATQITSVIPISPVTLLEKTSVKLQTDIPKRKRVASTPRRPTKKQILSTCATTQEPFPSIIQILTEDGTYVQL